MKRRVPILLAIGTGLSCLPPLVRPILAQASDSQSVAASADATLGALAQRYLAGDTVGPVAAVGSWDRGELEEEVQRLLSLQGVPGANREASLRAAATIVAESALGDLFASDLDTASSKLDDAVGLVDALTDPGSALFARRFYLFTGLVFQVAADVDAAYGVLNRALRRFRSDPEFQLAMGSIVETIAGLRRYDESTRSWSRTSTALRTRKDASMQSGTLLQQSVQVAVKDCFSVEGVRDSSRCMAPQTMEGAEARYSAALALQPDLLEARLRLGRVRLLRGDARGAVRELDKVLSQSRDRSQRQLAHLFRGAALEELGDPRRAVAAYEAATREAPHAQSSLIALGRACNHLGEQARAQEAFARVLRASPAMDPWWTYLHGQPGRLTGLIVELRGLVR